MRIAAIQLPTVVADVEANLGAAEQLVDEAARDGADWIILPEFFTTGVGFIPELADRTLTPDGAATQLLADSARRHGATVGGSFLCRDADHEVRNAFFLYGPDGLIGRHDKDIPTMWENCFYIGGSDDGILSSDGLDVGVTLCFEYNRTQSVWRLRKRVDLVVGGSFVWSSTPSLTGPFTGYVNRQVAQMAFWAPRFARLVGAPTVDATHACKLECDFPWYPWRYRGYTQGGACVSDAHGNVLAQRSREDGGCFAIADVEPRRVEPIDDPPHGYWITPLGPVASFAWWYQRKHGQRWYQRNTRKRPALELERERAGVGISHP